MGPKEFCGQGTKSSGPSSMESAASGETDCRENDERNPGEEERGGTWGEV